MLGANRIVTALGACTAIVILLGLLQMLFVATYGTDTMLRDLRHFALDGELNVGSWYSSLLMTAAALVCFLLARLDPDARQGPFWLVLSVLFLAMSLDETASFHEPLIDILAPAAEWSDLFHHAWVVVAIPFVIAFGLFSIPFLLRLERGVAIGFVIAGALFVFGALVMEMIDGVIRLRLGYDSLAYKTGALLEDVFELLGMTLFVATALRYLARMMRRTGRGIVLAD